MMARHRFFAEPRTSPPLAPGAAGDTALPLSDADVHHLRDVARLVPGEEIVLVEDGRALVVRLTQVGDEVRGLPIGSLESSPLPHVTLVQGLAKGEKMDDIVRQTTELGVSRIIPLRAERSVVRLDAAKAAARVARWARIAAEAAKQAQRVDAPSIAGPVAAHELGNLLQGSTVLVCWEDAAGAPGIAEAIADAALTPDEDVAVVVGPEGGLTETEVALLTAGGGRLVSLGDTVLRTETAGVVATALALFARGALGGR